jgi:hypothetical protein
MDSRRAVEGQKNGSNLCVQFGEIVNKGFCYQKSYDHRIHADNMQDNPLIFNVTKPTLLVECVNPSSSANHADG